MGDSDNTNLIIILMLLIIGFFVYIKQSQTNQSVSDNVTEETEGFCSKSSKRNYLVDKDGDVFDDHHCMSSCDSDSESGCDSDSNLLSLSDDEREVQAEAARVKRKCKQDMACLLDSMKSNKRVCSEFIEKQYHKDYNDTITAINNLTPQKELFNMGFLPVKEVDPDSGNIRELVKLFINRINDEVDNRVSEFLHKNSGWNDQGKRKKIKSGFEEQLEELGLPGDLYTQPADKAGIRLVAIEHAEQHMTDDQIRFIAHIVVQKKNVKDQMVIKVLFFMEREDLKNGGDHRENFFDKSVANHDRELDAANQKLDNIVIIEQVFTVGFLSDTGTSKTRMDKFYEYKDIQNQNGIIDQYKVLQIMKKKHAFLCSVDDETKELHDVPSIGDYKAYQNTRTIMDDLKINPQRSFGQIPM
jgi:hypothetical protein